MKKLIGSIVLLMICFILPQKVAFCSEELIDSLRSEELFDGSSEEIDTDAVIVDNNYIGNFLPCDEEISLESVFASGVIYCPREFVLHSKAGFMGTEIEIHQDWSFSIVVHSGGGFEQGPGYIYTMYFAELQGQFGEPIRLNEYTYCLPVLYTKPTYKEGYQYIANNTRYVAGDTKGLLDKDQLILYLPGTPLSIFPGPGSWMVSNCIDTEKGIIRDGSYVLDGMYVGNISSENDRLILPNSSTTPTPTVTPIPSPTFTPTPTPSPTPAVPFAAEVPPEVTGFYNSVKGADLRWTDVPGAEGYEVYRKRSADGTKKVATINAQDDTQYYDGEIKDNCWGRVYVYYIVPFAGDEEGTTSTQVTLQRLAPMKITECQNTSVGSVDLSWACTVNDNKALGYEIQYAESKEDLYGRTGSFRKFTVNGRNKLSKTITGLEAGKTYYFRIRCYVNYTHSVTGKQTKTWSQYSDVAEVMIEQ